MTADFVCTHLFQNTISQPNFCSDPASAIVAGFADTEKAWVNFANEREIDGNMGTTVTVAMIVDNNLYVANLGDTEAIISTNGRVKLLTQKHVPANREERSRVEQLGGIIISDRDFNYRIGHPCWNASIINLGVSRSIGDLYFKNEEYVGEKKSGLIAVPSVTKHELTVDDSFLLVASDGFWDVITPEEAHLFVVNTIHMDNITICQLLMEVTKRRKSLDNITILLVKLVVSTASQTIFTKTSNPETEV